jgi:ferredoxin
MANSKFESFLNGFDEKDWHVALTRRMPEIHEVDRAAVQIWFRFYPLSLFRYLQAAEDRDKALHGFAMQGDFELKDQIDSSHKFLYGHRYWKEVKEAIAEYAAGFSSDNADLYTVINDVSELAAKKAGALEPLVSGISIVGLMTVVQAGIDALKNAEGKIFLNNKYSGKTPDQIVAERAKDDSQGMFGFLKTIDKQFTVTWDENDPAATFKIIQNEEIASAAAKDQSKDWGSIDTRCIEGVIPVECRSASCGTCWVGVIGGKEKLSEVSERERKQMKVFGYNQPDDPRPFMRLACQAKASGNVTIVIPPWNGVFGKKVYGNVEDVDLEPATTAAKNLREKIASAMTNGGE